MILYVWYPILMMSVGGIWGPTLFGRKKFLPWGIINGIKAYHNQKCGTWAMPPKVEWPNEHIGNLRGWYCDTPYDNECRWWIGSHIAWVGEVIVLSNCTVDLSFWSMVQLERTRCDLGCGTINRMKHYSNIWHLYNWLVPLEYARCDLGMIFHLFEDFLDMMEKEKEHYCNLICQMQIIKFTSLGNRYSWTAELSCVQIVLFCS